MKREVSPFDRCADKVPKTGGGEGVTGFMTLVLFVVGLVLLIVGARLLVDGASALAIIVGMSPLVIGLTVVSFGTSAPELAVTVQASRAGQADVGVGNVVGSSVVNILVILGLSALIVPLVVSRQLLRRDGPVMAGSAILLLVLARDGTLSRTDGIILMSILVVYTLLLLVRGRQEVPHRSGPRKRDTSRLPLQIGAVVGGLIMLVIGARWLVNGAVALAGRFGLPEVVIGLTVVALGTSLPEIAASIQASIRGERDIAVGNVVGSNIYNVLAVLGLAAILTTGGIPVRQSTITFDLPVAIIVTFAAVLSFVSGLRVSRFEGAMFILAYVGYTTYLILDATNHQYEPVFRRLAIPLAVLFVLILCINVIQRDRDWHRHITKRSPFR
jgi:cation:H+ antiporter